VTPVIVYLDSSAIVKLVIRERESGALFDWLRDRPERVSSVVSRVEVLRALRRAGAPPATVRRAGDLLDRISLMAVDRPVLDAASAIGPRDLRSLDAIHLATALSLAGDLAGLVTYDSRLAAAAARSGVGVWSPA
jgi:predicted nucleic acid-binding protein